MSVERPQMSLESIPKWTASPYSLGTLSAQGSAGARAASDLGPREHIVGGPPQFTPLVSDLSERSRNSVSSTGTGYRSRTPLWPIKDTEPIKTVFVFVNPTSGGNAAAAFTNAGLRHAIFDDPVCEIFICDIREGQSGQKPGFIHLREIVNELPPGQLVYCVMAGGDGTVMWGVSELWEHGVDDSKVIIGVVPYGTGNDFARSLCWNAFNALNPFAEQMRPLKTLCAEWIAAPLVMHDIWEVQVDLKAGGAFKQIDGKTRKKIVLCNSNKEPLSTLKKKMCNYFSIGVESRIGMGFDRHRTQSQTKNKMVYMNEGIKKMVFHREIGIQDMISKLETEDHKGGTHKTVFRTDPGASVQLEHSASLIAINIPSFASGLDIWNNAERCALTGPGVRKDSQHIFDLMTAKQCMGDKKLEWLTFHSGVALGAEQAFKGRGKRVNQGRGPFVLSFSEQLPPETRLYFQIDGEYFQMQNASKVRISLFRQMKVVLNRESDRQCYVLAQIE